MGLERFEQRAGAVIAQGLSACAPLQGAMSSFLTLIPAVLVQTKTEWRSDGDHYACKKRNGGEGNRTPGFAHFEHLPSPVIAKRALYP